MNPATLAEALRLAGEIRTDLQAFRLRMTVAGRPVEQAISEAGWQRVAGVRGLWTRPMAPPPGVAVGPIQLFETCIEEGGGAENVAAPDLAGQTRVLAGELLWQQASQGAVFRAVRAGEVLTVAPGEAHSYIATVPTWCVVGLTPNS